MILDELTQGLDPAARRTVWAAIDQLRADGTSVLLVTHELDEAERLCDRVVAMRAGRVLDSGSPGELVGRYGRAVTISFTPSAGAADLTPGRAARPARASPAWAGRAAGSIVTGDRRAIAHVGAALVASGRRLRSTCPYGCRPSRTRCSACWTGTRDGAGRTLSRWIGALR